MSDSNKNKKDKFWEIHKIITSDYAKLIQTKYPSMVSVWPILSGNNFRIGEYFNYYILILHQTSSGSMRTLTDIEINNEILGVNEITNKNMSLIKNRLYKYFKLNDNDCVLLIDKSKNNMKDEINYMMKKHEKIMNCNYQKIFLSHKSIDKPKIDEFKETLKLLNFDPWFDEDDMNAGENLERSISNGFKNSCAAVFFVTKNFIDENYLSTEIEYAIREKREKQDNFSIITLVFDNLGKSKVPELLQNYIWKEPKSDLIALQEIIKAIPVKIREIY